MRTRSYMYARFSFLSHSTDTLCLLSSPTSMLQVLPSHTFLPPSHTYLPPSLTPSPPVGAEVPPGSALSSPTTRTATRAGRARGVGGAFTILPPSPRHCGRQPSIDPPSPLLCSNLALRSAASTDLVDWHVYRSLKVALASMGSLERASDARGLTLLVFSCRCMCIHTHACVMYVCVF